MALGMSQIDAQPRFNELPWSAIVKSVDAHSIWISAGSQENLKTGDDFVILAGISQGVRLSACQAYQVVAQVKATGPVSPVSMPAQFTWSDPKNPVMPGDTVMIRTSQ